MNLIQHPDFPAVEVAPMEGAFSYRNAWNEVMKVFHTAGFRVREPNAERRTLSPCNTFAWFFVVAGLNRHHEVLVTDQPLLPDMEEAVLSGAFGVVAAYPNAAFHIYSPEPLSQRLVTALSDEPAGRFLRRVSVDLPLADIRPMGVPYVAPRITKILGECWGRTVDLDAPGHLLSWLEDVVMELRGDRGPDDLLPTPGAILTPPLAAIGLVVAEVLRRHLPGPTKVHPSAAGAGFDRQEDDRLETQDWAFVVAQAGGNELKYHYGPGTVFARYCQGAEQSLVSLLPAEIAFPESDEAAAFVESLPD